MSEDYRISIFDAVAMGLGHFEKIQYGLKKPLSLPITWTLKMIADYDFSFLKFVFAVLQTERNISS
jgi:hypothetical protein